jgi:hypothetical protein
MKTSMRQLLFSLAAVAVLLVVAPTQASTRVLPFQGRLTDANGSPIADGSRVVQFKMYDAPVGGRAVWNGEVHKLSINSGLVSTLLGTKASLASVDFNQDLYLEITVDANADGQITLADPPLLPRQSVLPAVFAHESANARLLDGYDWSPLFGTNNPADGSLLESKIGDGSLGSSKIRDASIISAKIADGAVTRPKLDASGATAGQSLTYNGSAVVWSQVNALNAQTLQGYDWSSIFNGGNPQTGAMTVQSLASRSSIDATGGLTIGGRTFLNGLSTTIQGTLFAPTIGSPMYLNDWSIYFRNNGDNNHFLRYENAWAGQSGFDGPLLVGNAGGMLGTIGNWTLRWNSTGTVQVRSTISSGSDRNLKENFTPADTGKILNKVLALPLSRWNYKEDPAASHLGPMAQDFRAAFGLGSDDKTITMVDGDGVALAAIQGLHEKLEDQQDQLRNTLREQQQQIKALRDELEALKAGRR